MSIQSPLKPVWFLALGIAPQGLFAMHIMEGFLPVFWSIFWFIAAIPFLWIGMAQIRRLTNENSRIKLLLGVVGAFMFVLSALKLPSVTGSCSHPTGAGLGTILFGPFVMSIMGSIVLIFQTLLLAHGGLTTLGANVFTMAILGPLIAIGTYKLSKSIGAPRWAAVFLCAFLGDIATYLGTAFQLALAFPAEQGGYAASLVKFTGIFAFTQIPLAITEGILTVMIFNFIARHNSEDLQAIQLSRKGLI